MNKKFLALLLACVMIFGLAACGPKDVETPPVETTPSPEADPTPSSTPDDATSTEAPKEVKGAIGKVMEIAESTISVMIDNYTELFKFDENAPDTLEDVSVGDNIIFDFIKKGTDMVITSINKVIPGPDDDEAPLNDLTYTVFPEVEAEITFPESWRDNYYVEEEEDIGSIIMYTYEDMENKEGKTTLVEFVMKDKVEDEDTLENGVLVMTENDDFAILMYKNMRATDERIVGLINDVENDYFFYIPEKKEVPEAAAPLVEAITSSRSKDDNTYNEILCNPDETIVYDMLQLTSEDVPNFAMSMSMMNVKAYAVGILEAADNKVDTVMEALDTYVKNSQQSFENYLPDQLEIAKKAIVRNVGNYCVVVMCEDAETVYEGIESALNRLLSAKPFLEEDEDTPSIAPNEDSEKVPDKTPDELPEDKEVEKTPAEDKTPDPKENPETELILEEEKDPKESLENPGEVPVGIPEA